MSGTAVRESAGESARDSTRDAPRAAAPGAPRIAGLGLRAPASGVAWADARAGGETPPIDSAQAPLRVVQRVLGTAPVVQATADAAPSADPDPDAAVSLGPLDRTLVNLAARQAMGETQWTVLREFLRGLWGGVQAMPAAQRQRIEQKWQSLDAAGMARYAGGYALGIGEGLWDALRGMFEAAWTLLTLPSHVGAWLQRSLPALAMRYGPRLAALMDERHAWMQRGRAALERLLADPVRAARQLQGLLDSVAGAALGQVRRMGHGLAEQLLQVMEQPWFDYGRSIGKLVGMVLFEVTLAVASDAIGNVVKQAASWIGRLGARVVTGGVELLRTLGRAAGEAMAWLGRLARRVAGELGEALEGLRALLQRLQAVLSEMAGESALAEMAETAAGPMPVPRPALAVESRAVRPPTRTAPATVADLTPPKVHPSKASPTAGRPKPGSAPFDEPLAPDEIGLSPDELRRKQVLETFSEPAGRSRSAMKQEATTGHGRREVRRPGRSVPRPFERGQLAHEYAELLIHENELPRGLAREVRAELPGGKVRLDRVDFEQGVYYEIKPDSAISMAAGEDQLRIYAEYMNRNFPLPEGRQWVGRLVTYERQVAVGMFGL